MLVFDFDGVLIDSLDEVIVNAYNTAAGKLACSLCELGNDFVALLKSNRPVARSAGELAFLGKWCLQALRENPSARLDRTQLQELLGASGESMAALEEGFFTARTRLAEQQPQAWLALSRPYQPLWDGVIKCGLKPLVILTFKNRRAVLEICGHYGLKVCAENIYSGDNGTDKIQNLRAICDRFRIKALTFVDDSVHNLIELKGQLRTEIHLELLLATWGYQAPGDVELALDAGIRLVTQEDVLILTSRYCLSS